MLEDRTEGVGKVFMDGKVIGTLQSLTFGSAYPFLERPVDIKPGSFDISGTISGTFVNDLALALLAKPHKAAIWPQVRRLAIYAALAACLFLLNTSGAF